MREHGASPVTVQRAVSQLAAEGLVVPRPAPARSSPPPAARDGRAGPRLAGGRALRPRVDAGALLELLELPPEGALRLSSGYLDPALMPTAALAASLARAGRRPGAWERSRRGHRRLRAWFANEAGPRYGAHDVVVSPGGQAALVTALRALAPRDGVALVESPTYRGAWLAAAGRRPAGDAGAQRPPRRRPDHLAQALHRTGARLVYLQPLHANPHGATLAADRRAEILDAAGRAGAFVIEDDWARGMTFAGDEPPPLAADDVDGHVVYVRSLSKSASPGLRVAAVAARGPAGARLRAARVVEDLFVSAPLQHAALDLVSSPGWQRHLKALRAGLLVRRDAMLTAVRRHLGDDAISHVPSGGLHLWARLPEGSDERGVVAAAARAGVVVSGGARASPASRWGRACA